MSCNLTENTLTVQKRKILKTELPQGKIKAYYRIKLQNQETKQLEDAVMIHLKNSFTVLSLETKSVKYEIKKRCTKNNVVYMKESECIIMWEDKGDKLEMMKLPYDPNSAKAFQKVYEADEDLRYVRLTKIDGKECLAVVDEPKYIKIMKIEDIKVTILKDYFVDSYFSTYSDVNALKSYSYCNGMMYSPNGCYILQERGKEKEGKFYSLYYSQYSLDYNTTKFPMCTEDFILFSLSPEWDSSYTVQKQYLMLAPPMNSYKIKQREFDVYRNVEFFCPFDDRYIVYSNFDKVKNKGKITLDLYQLNGEVLQTVRVPAHKNMYPPTYSQSGKYFVIPTITDVSKEPDFSGGNRFKKQLIVYKIDPTEEFKQFSTSILDGADGEVARANSSVSKNIIQLEVFKVFDFPEEFQGSGKKFEELEEYGWENIQWVHVDNKGTTIYYHEEESYIVINDQNQTGKFYSILLENEMVSQEEQDNENKIVWDINDILRFGQGVICVKRKEKILVMNYDENGIIDGHLIKHKAVDIEEQCDLDDIILPKTPKYILLFYLISDALTIIVWDIEKDVEHLNFLGRKSDTHTDYLSGKNSKLGFLCFKEYIVDLDVCVPIPFMTMKIRTDILVANQGIRINKNEDVMLGGGTLVTPLCYKDIYYYKNKSLDNLDVQKVVSFSTFKHFRHII